MSAASNASSIARYVVTFSRITMRAAVHSPRCRHAVRDPRRAIAASSVFASSPSSAADAYAAQEDFDGRGLARPSICRCAAIPREPGAS